MKLSNLRRRVAVAGAIGAAALITSVGIAGVANATPYTPGTNPTNGVADPPAGYPLFNNGNINADRDAGSDTTFFMMQKLGDLYTGAGLYGCQLNTGSASDTLYNAGLAPGSTPANAACLSGDGQTTTENDNWSRTEISEGVDLIGSSNGVGQVCGTTTTPLPVNFARSSSPVSSTSTCNLSAAAYAKDGVNAVDFQIAPATLPTSTGTVPAATSPTYSSINNGELGDVAQGWLPGDPVTAVGNSTGTGAASGTPFTNLQNGVATPGTPPVGIGHDNPGSLTLTATVPYRIWCATNLTGINPRITDWGTLTNLGPNLAVPNVTSPGGVVTTKYLIPSSISVGGGLPLKDLSTPGNLPSGETVTAITPNGSGGDTLTLSNASGVSLPTSGNGDNLSLNIGTQLAAGSGSPVGIPVNVQGVNNGSGTYKTFSWFVTSATSSSANCNADANALHGRSLIENNASQVAEKRRPTIRVTSDPRPMRLQPRCTSSRTVCPTRPPTREMCASPISRMQRAVTRVPADSCTRPHH